MGCVQKHGIDTKKWTKTPGNRRKILLQFHGFNVIILQKAREEKKNGF